MLLLPEDLVTSSVILLDLELEKLLLRSKGSISREKTPSSRSGDGSFSWNSKSVLVPLTTSRGLRRRPPPECRLLMVRWPTEGVTVLLTEFCSIYSASSIGPVKVECNGTPISGSGVSPESNDFDASFSRNEYLNAFAFWYEAGVELVPRDRCDGTSEVSRC